ncbi:MAG: ATP-grasp domain-containing protein, partial [Elusimicrobiales bacterium]
SNHAPYVFKRHFVVPDVHTSNWLNVLNEVIGNNNIDYILPAHDDVVVALTQNAGKVNAKIISSPPSTCLICRSKSKTYSKFRDLLPVPEIFDDIS